MMLFKMIKTMQRSNALQRIEKENSLRHFSAFQILILKIQHKVI